MYLIYQAYLNFSKLLGKTTPTDCRPTTSYIIYFYEFSALQSNFYYRVFPQFLPQGGNHITFFFSYIPSLKYSLLPSRMGPMKLGKNVQNSSHRLSWQIGSINNLHYELSNFVTRIIERINILSHNVSDSE